MDSAMEKLLCERFTPAARALAGFAFTIMLALASLGFASLALVQPALALEEGSYTAVFFPSYANPDTGEIEDSGGQDSMELGTSMVEGVVGKTARIEVDAEGVLLVSLSFSQANLISDLSVAAGEVGAGSFGEPVWASLDALDESANVADYSFGLESTDVTLRFSMFVEPMGRDVVFFGQFGEISLPDGSPIPAATQADEPETSKSAESASAEAAASESAAKPSEESEPAPSAASSSGGVREYAADGSDVTGKTGTNEAAEGLNYPLIIGIALACLIAIVLIVDFAWLRPRRAKQQAAAKAAAAAKPDEEQKHAWDED